MTRYFRDQKGFTLIEMIIVVIIMGILAAVIIPRISMTTDQARLNTLKTNLTAMRSSVEIYVAQHDGAYPGARKNDGTANPTANDAITAFTEQLTQYTEFDGTVSATKTADAKYGPYIKGGALPTNPFNDSNAVVCDITTTNITTRDWDGTGTAGWHFYTKTGVLVANDSAAHATGL